jgi:hypothetical protein
VLSTGIYTVALKKLTTPATRSFAFGVQYGIFNLAGAIADIAADLLRRHDFLLPTWLPTSYLGGAVSSHGSPSAQHPHGDQRPVPTDRVVLRARQVWSGLRMHVFVTWLAVLASLVVAVLFLHDATLVPLEAPIASPFAYANTAPASPPPISEDELARLRANATEQQRAQGYIVAPIPRVKPTPPPNKFAPSPLFGRANLAALKEATSPSTWLSAVRSGIGRALQNTRELCELNQFWRALWLSVCLLFLSKQWGDLDQLLPPFLERHYGVDTPIYAGPSDQITPHHATPRHTTPHHATPHHATPRHATPP